LVLQQCWATAGCSLQVQQRKRSQLLGALVVAGWQWLALLLLLLLLLEHSQAAPRAAAPSPSQQGQQQHSQWR
jgi:hypothetical protein